MKKEEGIEDAEGTEAVPAGDEQEDRATTARSAESLLELRGTVEWEGDLESWREARTQESPA